MATHVDRGPVPARRGPTTPAWIIGAVVLVIVAAVGVGVLIRANTGTEPRTEAPISPATGPTTPPSAYAPGSAADELSRYVLPYFLGPNVAEAFTMYPENEKWTRAGETWTIVDIAGTFDIATEDLERVGFVDAYGTAWVTPDWLAGTGKDLVSLALLFESPAGAHEGFALFDFGTFERWQPLPTRGLGAEAIAAEGRLDGYPTVAYIWRVWDLVLVVGSQGSLSPEVVGPLADDVQALVERFL